MLTGRHVSDIVPVCTRGRGQERGKCRVLDLYSGDRGLGAGLTTTGGDRLIDSRPSDTNIDLGLDSGFLVYTLSLCYIWTMSVTLTLCPGWPLLPPVLTCHYVGWDPGTMLRCGTLTSEHP